MELRKTAALMDGILRAENAAKYSYTLCNSEKQELNLENGEFKLLRTVFNNTASLKLFDGAKMGSASGNDLTEVGLKALLQDAKAAAASATEDECHDIAPGQGKHVFRQGVCEPDMDRFIERIKEFLDTAAKEYPKVRIMMGIGSYDRWSWITRNTNGTEFEGFGGIYHFSIEICATDGEKTTGLDYTGVGMKTLDTPFMELGDLRKHMESVQNSMDPQALEGKFTGTVIMTPGCATDFIYMTLMNYISGGVIIDGTSLWLDKVGEQVADEKLTIAMKPFDERIINGERATGSNFLAEDVTLIEKGVLKTHWLNLYAANKTGRPVVKNTGSDLVVSPGDRTLDELIASVDRGLLMGGFSGGQPGTNGEFSGVAKNSFLIENGRIKCAVTETMVNGNLGEAFRSIRGISKELCCDGGSVVPYIAVDGIVISGK
ncbi:MAG: TldD/PmbA family protein [Clostridiales bacterium]|nr:TldD/PmbA family protein [Clostridiales bacterium]